MPAELLDEVLHGLGLDTLRGKDELVQIRRDSAEQKLDLIDHQVVPFRSVPPFLEYSHGLRQPVLVPPSRLHVAPRVDRLLREHLLKTLSVRHAVIAYLADEYALGLRVERILVVASRSPEMILRDVFRAIGSRHKLLAPVRRRRQVRSCRIHLVKHRRDGHP